MTVVVRAQVATNRLKPKPFVMFHCFPHLYVEQLSQGKLAIILTHPIQSFRREVLQGKLDMIGQNISVTSSAIIVSRV